MTALAELLRRLPPVVCALLGSLDNLLAVASCALFAAALFHSQPRKKPLYYALCAALCVAFGLWPAPEDKTAALLWAAAGLALPFCCMALLFRAKGLWKAMLAAAGYAFAEAARFLILLLFFRFDYNDRNDELETLVGLCVDLVFFLLAYLLLTRWARRHTVGVNVTKNGAILFLLIVLSVGVLVTTLLVLGSSYSETRRAEFAFMLLNVPVLTGTATFALACWLRMRSEADGYRRQLDMQIRQFEWMEQMAEDVRTFRHDLPKKMRPLIAYLDEDRPEEAKRMAEQFSDFALQTGERFHTGNYRLDTVLFCEQQIAQREGARIDVPFDTVFPREGIAPDDIYTIFPNALDNAIEACRGVDGERVVSFRSHMNKQTVYVTIRNPMTGELRLRNGLPRTGKPDKTAHGYGLRSIKKAAARYGTDNVSFTAENGVFELRFFLRFAANDPGTDR